MASGVETGRITTDIPGRLDRLPWSRWHWLVVIGLGTGITSGSLLQHRSLESLDLVEIEPAVLEASDFFREYNHSPLQDPRTRVIVQDGRTYVGFGSRTYDLITSDPIHPWVKGAANLYTVEYYQHARRRLNDGGIFCQWIPSTMSVRAFRSILRTIHEAFPHVKFLFADREVVALPSLEPIEVRPDEIRERVKEPEVQKSLGGMYLSSPEKVLELLEKDLHPISATNHQLGDLNTDDNVLLEHLLPWDTFHGHVVRIRPSRPTPP